MELGACWSDEAEDAFDIFYKDEVRSIRIVFLYINKKNELIFSKKFHQSLNNERITKSQMIYLLKQNYLHDGAKFYPLQMLQFNVGIESREVSDYVDGVKPHNFLSLVHYIHAIPWKRTIKYFQPLNSLYILMKERSSSRSSTKKIILFKKRRKTRRRSN